MRRLRANMGMVGAFIFVLGFLVMAYSPLACAEGIQDNGNACEHLDFGIVSIDIPDEIGDPSDDSRRGD